MEQVLDSPFHGGHPWRGQLPDTWILARRGKGQHLLCESSPASGRGREVRPIQCLSALLAPDLSVRPPSPCRQTCPASPNAGYLKGSRYRLTPVAGTPVLPQALPRSPGLWHVTVSSLLPDTGQGRGLAGRGGGFVEGAVLDQRADRVALHEQLRVVDAAIDVNVIVAQHRIDHPQQPVNCGRHCPLVSRDLFDWTRSMCWEPMATTATILRDCGTLSDSVCCLPTT